MRHGRHIFAEHCLVEVNAVEVLKDVGLLHHSCMDVIKYHHGASSSTQQQLAMKLITFLTLSGLAVAAPTVTELIYYCTGLDGKGDCGAVYTTGCGMSPS
jgi:hypothetical protein